MLSSSKVFFLFYPSTRIFASFTAFGSSSPCTPRPSSTIRHGVLENYTNTTFEGQCVTLAPIALLLCFYILKLAIFAVTRIIFALSFTLPSLAFLVLSQLKGLLFGFFLPLLLIQTLLPQFDDLLVVLLVVGL